MLASPQPQDSNQIWDHGDMAFTPSPAPLRAWLNFQPFPGMVSVSCIVSHPEAVLGESRMGEQENESECEGCSALSFKIGFTACSSEFSARSEKANGLGLPRICSLLLLGAEIPALPRISPLSCPFTRGKIIPVPMCLCKIPGIKSFQLVFSML